MKMLTLTRATILYSHHHDDRHFGFSSHYRCFLSIHPISPPPPLIASKRQRVGLSFITRAADSTQPSSAAASATNSANKTLVTDDEITLAKVRIKDPPFNACIFNNFSNSI